MFNLNKDCHITARAQQNTTPHKVNEVFLLKPKDTKARIPTQVINKC